MCMCIVSVVCGVDYVLEFLVLYTHTCILVVFIIASSPGLVFLCIFNSTA